MQESSWSLGTLIGLPVFVLLVFVSTIVAGLAARRWLKVAPTPYGDERFGAALIGGIAAFTAVTCAIALALGFYPYKAEYHQWRTVTAEVAQIDSRLVSGGEKSVSQRFVVNLQGVGERACDDTRCAGVKVGDLLTLTCKREWQYTGTDGFGCNFVKNESTK